MCPTKYETQHNVCFIWIANPNDIKHYLEFRAEHVSETCESNSNIVFYFLLVCVIFNWS